MTQQAKRVGVLGLFTRFKNQSQICTPTQTGFFYFTIMDKQFLIYILFCFFLVVGLPAILVNACQEKKIISGTIIEHSVTSNRSGTSYNTLIRYDNADWGIHNETDLDLYVLPVGSKIYKQKWVLKK